MDTTLLKRVEVVAAALGGIATVVWAIIGSVPGALSVALGVVIGVVNFTVLRRIVAGVMNDGANRGRYGAWVLIKFLVLAVLLYLVISVVGLDAAALAVGLSATMVAVFIESLGGASRGVAEDEAAPGASTRSNS